MSLIENLKDGAIAATIGGACGAAIGGVFGGSICCILKQHERHISDFAVGAAAIGAVGAVALGTVGFLGGTAYSFCHDLYYDENVV